MEGPKYFITRSDPLDPASSLDFFPPKGSDELHEALKQSYPHLKNLQARMRQAVIDFCLAEHQEQAVLDHFTSPTVSDQPTPEYVSFNNMTPFTTTMSFPNTPAISEQTSPEYMAYSLALLPADMPSLFPQAPQSSQAPALPASPKSTSRLAVPTQEELTNVWALPSKPDAKIHKRRCMTSAEKAAYKQKRLAGVCADCKRRRRKCKHNTTSVSTPSSSASSASIASKRQPARSKSPTISQPPLGCASNISFSDMQHTSVNTNFSMLGDFVADLDFQPRYTNADMLADFVADLDFQSWYTNADMLADNMKPYELPTEVDPLIPFSNSYDLEFIDFSRAAEPTPALSSHTFQSAPAMSRGTSSSESDSSFGHIVVNPDVPPNVLPHVLPEVLPDVLPDVLRRSRGLNSLAGLKIAIPGLDSQRLKSATYISHSASSSALSGNSGTAGPSSSSASQSAVSTGDAVVSPTVSSPTSNSTCSTCWLLVCSACHSVGGTLFGSAAIAALTYFSGSLLSALLSFLVLLVVQETMPHHGGFASLAQQTFGAFLALHSLKNGTTRKNTLSGALSSFRRSISLQRSFQSLPSDKALHSSSRRLDIGQRKSALSLSHRLSTALSVAV